jgi:hypothetical protein
VEKPMISSIAPFPPIHAKKYVGKNSIVDTITAKINVTLENVANAIKLQTFRKLVPVGSMILKC